MSSGNKYHRTIRGIKGRDATVDVYAVLVAFDVRCPARQHAIKKLLCAGIRGKGGVMQDLQEAYDAIERAMTLEQARAAYEDDEPDDKLAPPPCIRCNKRPCYMGGNVCQECSHEILTQESVGSMMQTPCVFCGRLLYYTDELQPKPSSCDDCASKTQTKP